MADHSVHLHIHEDFSGQVNSDLLRLAARQALLVAEAPVPASLTVAVVTAETVQTLNAQHRGEDSATDVLSFPPGDIPYATEPGEPIYLGDVLVAFPVAERQAREAGHSTQDELHLLAVHGVLHLLGHDHYTEEESAAMKAAEKAGLDALREAAP